MTADTPYHWLSRVAAGDPHRACLIDDDGVLTYRDVLERVDARSADVRQELTGWEIVPVPVRITTESIIEILAIQDAGAVPYPFVGSAPSIPVATAPETAVCMGTSGSGGARKTVPLTFENVRASVHASRNLLKNTSSDRWLLCLPLNHVGGLSIVWRSLEAGGSAVVMPFDSTGSTIGQFDPTFASMVPTMVQRLADSNIAALASLELLLVGGAALGRPLWDRCIQSGVRLAPTYGLTEAGSQVATAIPGEAGASAGAGRPLDAMEIRIMGLDRGPVETGQPGLISIDGPAVFTGYLGEDPRQGRFLTTDIGWLDDKGNLHVEGRADDVIVSGGENVSLGRVASTISGIDGIDDVCVVGIDDPDWGSIGGAMVVSRLALDSLDTMVREVLEPYEQPKRWIVRSSIPALANGKHDLVAVRRALEEEVWT